MIKMKKIFFIFLFVLISLQTIVHASDLSDPVDFVGDGSSPEDVGSLQYNNQENIDSGATIKRYTNILPRQIRSEIGEDGVVHYYYENNDTEIRFGEDNTTGLIDRGRNFEAIGTSSAVDENGKFSVDTSVVSRIFMTEDDAKRYFNPDSAGIMIENIIEADPNSNLSIGMKKGEELRTLISSSLPIVPEYVKCYISRQLTPMFYCPYESVTAVYGGNIELFQNEAREDCNSNCKVTSTCMSSPIDTGESAINLGGYANGSLEVANRDSYTTSFSVSDLTITEAIEFNFQVNYDPNNEMTEEDIALLRDVPYNIKISISGKLQRNGEWAEIVHLANVKLDDKIIRAKFYLGEVFTDIRITFFSPYINIYNKETNRLSTKSYSEILEEQATDLANGTEEEGYLQVSSIIASANVLYMDSKIYYCPETQFVSDNSDFECTGEIRHSIVGGVLREICYMPNSYVSGSEPTTGAFYNQQQCNARCYIEQDCRPTYAVPTTGGAIDTSSYQATVGCVDDGDNPKCTKELCESLYADINATVLEEASYYNDIERLITVKSGITVAQRPAIDYVGETSSVVMPNSPVFLNSMKDHAYAYMSNFIRYTASESSLGEATKIVQNNRKEELDGDRALYWQLKPSNIAYDGYPKYQYVIAKVFQSYLDRSTTSSSGDGMKYQDISYVEVLGVDNLTTFRITPRAYYLDSQDTTGTTADGNTTVIATNTKWKELAYNPNNDIVKKWSDSNGEFLAYSENDNVGFISSSPFLRTEIYHEKKILSSIYGVIENKDGILIKNQVSNDTGVVDGKKYSGVYQLYYRGQIVNLILYGFYTNQPIKYNQLPQYLVDENIFYNHTNSSYGQEIIGDGNLNDNIELYLKGSINNMSVLARVKPASKEYGKKAFIFTLMR